MRFTLMALLLLSACTKPVENKVVYKPLPQNHTVEEADPKRNAEIIREMEAEEEAQKKRSQKLYEEILRSVGTN